MESPSALNAGGELAMVAGMEKERPVPPLVYARVLRAISAAESPGYDHGAHEPLDASSVRLAESLEKEFSIFLIQVRPEELVDIPSVLELAQLISRKIGE